MGGGLIVDTDILIDLLRKKDYAVSLIKRLEDDVELATSAINVFELYRGAYKSQNQEKNLASVKGLLNQYPRHQPTSIFPIFAIRNPSLELKLGLVFAVAILMFREHICYL